MRAHIERSGSDYEAPVTHVTMYCGAQGIVFDNGEIVPADLDFYAANDGHKSNCATCVATQAIETIASRLRVPV